MPVSKNSPDSCKKLHPDLLIVIEYFFDACGIKYTQPIKEAESMAYGAYTFTLDKKDVLFRVAKITPHKNGLFVTVWKRDVNGITQPYHSSDKKDLFIISCRSTEGLGVFIFPKEILQQQGITSNNEQEGKRGIRVYPPWVEATSKQAKKTQQWQKAYFLELLTYEEDKYSSQSIKKIKAQYHSLFKNSSQ